MLGYTGSPCSTALNFSLQIQFEEKQGNTGKYWGIMANTVLGEILRNAGIYWEPMQHCPELQLANTVLDKLVAHAALR